MKLVVFILASLTITAQAKVLHCEAWSQKLGQELIRVPLEYKGIEAGSNDEMYRAELSGYTYKVDWSKQLDTLYSSVVMSEKAHIFATIRVPDLQIHNDAFLDSTNEAGDRVSISCNVSE